MTPVTCPHCGLGFDAPEHTYQEAATPLDSARSESLPVIPDISAGASHGVETDPVPSTGPRRTLPRSLLALGAVGVALLAWVLLAGRGSGSDGETVDESEPVGQVERIDDSGTGDGVDAGNRSGASGDPNFPPSDDHLIADDVAELFRSWLNGEDDWAVVYPSPVGLQVLDATGPTQPSVEVAVGFEEAARFPLITDGSTSWAVEPSRLDRAYLVSTNFVVIDIDRDGRVAFINDSVEPPNIGESSYGAWGPGFDVPSGSEIFPVPGRGLFVLPSTGGTFEYTFNAVEQLSDDILVAASIDSEVYERCDEALACELYLTRPGESLSTLADLGVDVDSRVWISPGGRWLVAVDRFGASRLIDLDTTAERVIEDRVRAVDWSDDGTRAAFLTDDELVVFRSDLDEVRSVTLPIAASAGSVLLVND